MFFDVLIPFEKIFPGNISKFLLEVPKFKQNAIICIITIIKWHDLLLTFTNNSNTCGIIPKMNEHRLFILINTSYIVNYQLSCRNYFHFAEYNSFSSEIGIDYSRTLHNAIFLNLISYINLLLDFFSLASRFFPKSVGKHCFKQQNIIKMKFIINASNIPYCL